MALFMRNMSRTIKQTELHVSILYEKKQVYS